MERIKKIIAVILLSCMAVMVNTAYAEYNRDNHDYNTPDNGTEFGAQDDLVVLGTGGNWFDPDVEIYGFTIFGSTIGVTPKISASTGSVFIGGNLQVEATSYMKGLEIDQLGNGVSNLTFTGASDHRGKVLRLNSVGYVEFVEPKILDVTGDNLGNHIATKTLDMSGYGIINIQQLQFGNANLVISTDSAHFGGAGSAVKISTNVEVGGNIYAPNLELAQNLTVGGSASITSALTVGGAASFNGNVTIGAASTDTLTINPSVVKHVPSKVDYKDDTSGATIAFFRKK